MNLTRPPSSVKISLAQQGPSTHESEQRIKGEGFSRCPVDVKIYRLEHDPQWALEVVNDEGTSIVWDQLFDTDDEAYAAFQLTVEEEGMRAFLDDDNVIPFPRRS